MTGMSEAVDHGSAQAFERAACEATDHVGGLRPSARSKGEARRFARPDRRTLIWGTGVLCGVLGLGGGLFRASSSTGSETLMRPLAKAASSQAGSASVGSVSSPSIELTRAQQEAIQLRTARGEMKAVAHSMRAPGRVAPDLGRYAVITPRSPGVVRAIHVNLGEEVKAGQVLATVDSREVGRARLELRTQLQSLEVAEAQALWQEAAYANTLELIKGLRRGDDPDAIQHRLEGRPVGAGRERIMTAYSAYRLAQAALERNEGLARSKVVSLSQLQQAKGAYEAAAATYQALLDRTEYDMKMTNLQARQARRQARTAVGVAHEQLKILGVDSSDVSLEDQEAESENQAVPPATRAHDHDPLSTYALVAPFNGTIIDRKQVAPGVALDATAPLFTIADLSTVWLEVNVTENDFDVLARAKDATLAFESPAYPGKTFEGKVIYRGDLVDEASRSVKLLASTSNPDRLLKPGMFISATVSCLGTYEAVSVPESALVTQGRGTYVFVKLGPERFERRPVQAGGGSNGLIAMTEGLSAGDEVVVQGASKLKARTIQAADEALGASEVE